jgi:hypothetical protein
VLPLSLVLLKKRYKPNKEDNSHHVENLHSSSTESIDMTPMPAMWYQNTSISFCKEGSASFFRQWFVIEERNKVKENKDTRVEKRERRKEEKKKGREERKGRFLKNPVMDLCFLLSIASQLIYLTSQPFISSYTKLE